MITWKSVTYRGGWRVFTSRLWGLIGLTPGSDTFAGTITSGIPAVAVGAGAIDAVGMGAVSVVAVSILTTSIDAVGIRTS